MRTAAAVVERAGLVALSALAAALFVAEPALAQDVESTEPAEGAEPPEGEAPGEPTGRAEEAEPPEAAPPELAPDVEPRTEGPGGASALAAPTEQEPVGTEPPEWPPPDEEASDAAAHRSLPETPEEEPEPIHAYPIRAALRPLTLTQGTGTMYSGFSARLDRLVMYFPSGGSVGVTDDFELGIRYPIPFEPELQAAGRFFHTEWLELGMRGFIRVPMFWQGDTVMAAEALVLLRAGDVLRVVASGGLDLLFSDPVQPLPFAALSAELSLFTHFFVGARGWIGSDNDLLAGSAGGYLGWTAASPRFPIVDIRVGVDVSPQLDRPGVTLYLLHTFYPRWFDSI